MSLPKVTVIYSNGNLLQDIAAIDGIAGIVGTVETSELIGAPKVVYNLADAVDQGFTEEAEAFMYRHLKEFYDEVAGNQELHVMGVANTATMTNMLDDAVSVSAKKLIDAADGKIRLLGVVRSPDEEYSAGAAFFDSDVSAAVTKAGAFGAARLAELRPLRVLIEGRIVNEGTAIAYTPKTAAIDYAGVVVGGSKNDGSASVGTALGRAVRYAAHIKIGKVANGPLQIATAYIGTKTIKEYSGLATLHGNGCISFMNHPQKAGIYFGIDRMANTADYRLLAYGRVVDKAAVIAAAVYVEELESEVDVDADGKISELDIQHLKGRLEQQINVSMGDQISGVDIYIDPAQDIITTSKLEVKLRVRPKGYTSFIEVDLGLVAPAVA